MSEEEEKDKIKKKIKYIGIFGWVIVAIGFFVFIYGFYDCYYEGKLDEVGGFVGGISGSLWALAGLFFIYIAFLGQKIEIKNQQTELKLNRKELELNREEFKLNRKELEESKEVYKQQANIMLNQQYDNTFFNLLDNHRKLVNNFKDRERIKENITGYDVLESIRGSLKWYLKKYSSFLKTRNIFDSGITNSNPIDEIKKYHIIKILYTEVSGIITFISEKIREENKEFYFNTLFNNLSTQEKFLLTAYNINISKNYKAELDFKGYLKYNFKDFSKETFFISQTNTYFKEYKFNEGKRDIKLEIFDENPKGYQEYNLYLVDKDKKVVTHIERISEINDEISIIDILTKVTEKYFPKKFKEMKNIENADVEYKVVLQAKNSKYNFSLYNGHFIRLQIENKELQLYISLYNEQIPVWIQDHFNNLNNQ